MATRISFSEKQFKQIKNVIKMSGMKAAIQFAADEFDLSATTVRRINKSDSYAGYKAAMEIESASRKLNKIVSDNGKAKPSDISKRDYHLIESSRDFWKEEAIRFNTVNRRMRLMLSFVSLLFVISVVMLIVNWR